MAGFEQQSYRRPDKVEESDQTGHLDRTPRQVTWTGHPDRTPGQATQTGYPDRTKTENGD